MLTSTPIGESLFGNDLNSRVKSAKDLEKAALQLKSSKKPVTTGTNSTFRGQGNYQSTSLQDRSQEKWTSQPSSGSISTISEQEDSAAPLEGGERQASSSKASTTVDISPEHHVSKSAGRLRHFSRNWRICRGIARFCIV